MTFRPPMSYKPEEIHEVMQIPITVDIGHHRYPRVIESIDGIIISGTLERGPIVDTLTIETTTGEIRTVNIRVIKQFRARG